MPFAHLYDMSCVRFRQCILVRSDEAFGRLMEESTLGFVPHSYQSIKALTGVSDGNAEGASKHRRFTARNEDPDPEAAGSVGRHLDRRFDRRRHAGL